MIRLIIYLLIAGVCIYSSIYEAREVPVLDDRYASWFSKLKFLTSINLTFQSFYYGLCAIRALVDTVNERHDKGPHRRHPAPPSYYPNSKLHNTCDFLYAVIAFPLGMAVCMLFWGLYAVDRELVFPKELDKIIPHWLNQCMHTAPIPFLLVDTLLVCHRMPARKTGCVTFSALGAFYIASLFVWREMDGHWAYPVLELIEFPYRLMFFVVALLLGNFLYLMGDALNRMLWGTASHPETGQAPAITRKKLRRD